MNEPQPSKPRDITGQPRYVLDLDKMLLIPLGKWQREQEEKEKKNEDSN